MIRLKTSTCRRAAHRLLAVVLLGALIVAAPGAARAGVQPGQSAPGFTLLDRNGVAFSLADFRGQVVLLDFIGYNCQPCIQDAMGVEAIWQVFQGQPFQVLALDFWNGTAFDVQFFIDQTGVTFPVLRDAAFLSLQSQYGLSFDNFVVVDANGIVRYTSENEAFDPFNDQAIRSAIQSALQDLQTPVEQVNWATIKELYR